MLDAPIPAELMKLSFFLDLLQWRKMKMDSKVHFAPRWTIENSSKLCFCWNGKDRQFRLAEKGISWSHDLQGHKQKVWLSRQNQSLSLKTAENNGAVDVVRCIMLHPYIMCLGIMRHEMYKSITNDIDTAPILVLDPSRWCFLSCTANAESNPCDDLPSWTHQWPPLPAQLRRGFACCVAPMFWTLTPLFWYSDVQVCD